MGQLVKSVSEEVIGEELRSKLKKIGTVFLSQKAWRSGGEFAVNYTTDYNNVDDHEDTDIVPSTDDDGLEASREIIITGGYRKLRKRQREAVIRFKRFNWETANKVWDTTAPSTEESRACCLDEGSEVLTEVAQKKLQANTAILNASQSLAVHFEAAGNKEEIPPNE
uniref:Uncharacterized protein n=1 Tax=Amphimedon queenslandica TaxID=400682 RepID=A0A1X7UUQ3_AMPQE